MSHSILSHLLIYTIVVFNQCTSALSSSTFHLKKIHQSLSLQLSLYLCLLQACTMYSSRYRIGCTYIV